MLRTVPVGLKYRHCSAHNHPPDTRRKHCKNWLLLVMQSSLQGWKVSALAAWSHFLSHEWWWIWRILGDMPRGRWCISCTPDRNHSTLLPYWLVSWCKPSRGADWQWLWSSTKASGGPWTFQAATIDASSSPHCSAETCGLGLGYRKSDP